jgi:hypothetical protein
MIDWLVALQCIKIVRSLAPINGFMLHSMTFQPSLTTRWRNMDQYSIPGLPDPYKLKLFEVQQQCRVTDISILYTVNTQPNNVTYQRQQPNAVSEGICQVHAKVLQLLIADLNTAN